MINHFISKSRNLNNSYVQKFDPFFTASVKKHLNSHLSEWISNLSERASQWVSEWVNGLRIEEKGIIKSSYRLCQKKNIFY
jgi:hypothetical protein